MSALLAVPFPTVTEPVHISLYRSLHECMQGNNTVLELILYALKNTITTQLCSEIMSIGDRDVPGSLFRFFTCCALNMLR